MGKVHHGDLPTYSTQLPIGIPAGRPADRPTSPAFSGNELSRPYRSLPCLTVYGTLPHRAVSQLT